MTLPLPQPQPTPAAATPPPTFGEAVRFWFKLGFISFGGPAGHIAIMHSELVERRKWLSESHFLHALNYCMLLPGPEATQLAIYIGWKLHRTLGGIAAGVLFILPAVFILWALSAAYVMYGHVGAMADAFAGLKAAVLAIVAFAAIRIGRRVLRSAFLWLIAAAAFAALTFLDAPFPLIMLGAGVCGLLAVAARPDWFRTSESPSVKAVDFAVDAPKSAANAPTAGLSDMASPHHSDTRFGRTARIILIGVMVWAAPIIAAGLMIGWSSPPVDQGLFFSSAALVTFGGAYAVLPYVAEEAVNHFHWLSSTQMMDGLGLAETTPGPLIMVVQFVGFVGGFNLASESGVTPLAGATIGAFMATWTTFVPSFLFILVGAPHVERLRTHPRLAAALTTITAAVVGVILNLAVWFGQNAIFGSDTPSLSTIDWVTIILSIASFIALAWQRWNIVAVVLGCAAAGVLRGQFMPTGAG